MQDNSLWGSAKTIYDPCPAGWRIPEGGYNDGMGDQGLADGIWAKAGFPSKGNYPFADMDSGKYGKVFTSQYCTPDTWYPAAGRTGRNTGKDQSKEDYPGVVEGKVRSVVALEDGVSLKYKVSDGKLNITLPKTPDSTDYIIKVSL